jgi:hypothetical protein
MDGEEKAGVEGEMKALQDNPAEISALQKSYGGGGNTFINTLTTFSPMIL